MKKKLLATILGVALCLAPTTSAYASVYATCGVVTAVAPESDVVFITQANGNYWCEIIDDADINDVFAMLMENNGTPEVTDDICVEATYCGSVQDFREIEVLPYEE